MATEELERRDYYVYVLFRETGHPFYVGKGKGTRMGAHVRAARRGEDTYRFRVIRQILDRRIDVPAVKIAVNLTNDEAVLAEVALIKALGRAPSGPLLNLTNGGDGTPGFKQSEKHREAMLRLNANRTDAMKLALIVRNKSVEQRAAVSRSKKGSKQSPEVLARLSAIRKGKRHSAAAKRRMSDAHKRIGSKPPVMLGNRHAAGHVAWNKGLKATAEVREKLRLAHLGKSTSRKGQTLSERHKASLREAWVLRKKRSQS